MSDRASFWGSLSLLSLALGGCLLADVGIDPALDPPAMMAVGESQTAGSGGNGSGGSATTQGGSAGGSGAGALAPEAGSGGEGGNAGSQDMPPAPAQGGSAGSASGSAGSAGMPANAGAAGSGSVSTNPIDIRAAEVCPDALPDEELCLNYCVTYTTACSNFSAGGLTPYDYENTADCADFCFRQSGWERGTINTPNTILCRCWHAVAAATTTANPHCFHAARVPSGGGCQ